MSSKVNISVDKIKVVTYRFTHRVEGKVYINPVTDQEFIVRKILIEGHLDRNLFPFWVNTRIDYPTPPSDYPDCRKVFYTSALTLPFSAEFKLSIDMFDDMAYQYGQIGPQFLLVPLEGNYTMTFLASWLPLGISVPASEPVTLSVNTMSREDEVIVRDKRFAPPSRAIYTER